MRRPQPMPPSPISFKEAIEECLSALNMGSITKEDLFSEAKKILDAFSNDSKIETVIFGDVKCTAERLTAEDVDPVKFSQFGKTGCNENPQLLRHEICRVTKRLDACSLYENDPVRRNWTSIWKYLAEEIGASFLMLNAGDATEMILRKPKIIPHIRPIWLIIVEQDKTTVISPITDASYSLAQILRFPHRNLDALHLLYAQLFECGQQLVKMQIYPVFTPYKFKCDNVLWLEYDVLQYFKTDRSLKSPASGIDLSYCTNQWRMGKTSNLDYILQLNDLAGRKRGAIHNHPIVPWVVDFTSSTSGWRPLHKSKYRLQKGDPQLQQMFKSEQAHHIPELLSDHSYMVYRARVETKENLCKYVRATWEPREYPASVKRMYDLAPDECIPELYEDPNILKSTHNDMPDLELPLFSESPSEFIKWHRSRLESDEVSAQLHEWIDLVFGYKLSGQAAIDSLNVHLGYADKSTEIVDHGVVQLFQTPHPSKFDLESEPKTNFYGMTRDDEAKLEGENLNDENDERKEDGDDNNLMKLYNQIKRVSKFCTNELVPTIRSLLNTMIEIALPTEFSRRGESDWYTGLNYNHALKYQSKLPRHLRDVFPKILKLALDENTMPTANEFFKDFPVLLNIPADVQKFHSLLCTFYACHLVRCYACIEQTEKTQANALHGEVERLRGCLLLASGSQNREERLTRLVARLLNNQKASIAAVSRLFPAVCRVFSKSSVDLLLQPLKNLLHDDNTVKLLDRRFLLQVSIAYGAKVFLNEIVPTLVEAVASKIEDRSIVAKESILWLAKRYGPVVCARFISSNLLRVHATCYSNLEIIKEHQVHKDAFNQPLYGDAIGVRVELCLAEIAASYSSTFISVQYVPFCCEIIEQVLRRGASQFEASLISVLRITRLAMRSFGDNQLMSYLEDIFMGKIIEKLTIMVCSSDFNFTTVSARRALASKILAFLLEISRRIGAENVRMYGKQPFETFFNAFVTLYEANEELALHAKPNANKTLLDAFPPVVRRIRCGDVLRRMGSANAIFLLLGSLLLGPICVCAKCTPDHCNMTGVSSGNRLYSLSSAGTPTSYLALGGAGAFDSGGSLSNLWCARVSAAVCGSGTKHVPRFDQITLCTFSGHSGAIRRIESLSNENSFVTTSSDKTVKLWSIRHDQETSQCQWTYKGHSGTVRDVRLLASGLIASTDGYLHVWDPFRGALHSQLEWGGDGMIHCIDTLDRHTLVASSSLHSSIKIHDTRMADWVAEFRINPAPGVVRSLSVHGNRMAISLSNGTVAVVDPRTGRVGSLSYGNYTHASSINWISPTCFIVADSDEEAVVFEAAPRIERRWSTPDPVLCMSAEGDSLATIQTGNNFRLYSNQEMILNSKIKSDIVSGQVTALAYLPLNNTFLIGANNGNIKLLC
ncbi:unnamed protein product, partial [Mesorhabditis spiculigera]